jgi:hypothetical protein
MPCFYVKRVSIFVFSKAKNWFRWCLLIRLWTKKLYLCTKILNMSKSIFISKYTLFYHKMNSCMHHVFFVA